MRINITDDITLRSDEHNWVIEYWTEDSRKWQKPRPTKVQYYGNLPDVARAVAEQMARDSESLEELKKAVIGLGVRIREIIELQGVGE